MRSLSPHRPASRRRWSAGVTSLALAGSVLTLSAPPASAGHEYGPPELYPTCEPGHVPDAPFADIAGSTHEFAIECLHGLGLVQGVTPDRFSTGALVRRDQIASLLARTLAFLRFPLPAGEDRFIDIDGNTHEDNIERLAAAGIIFGTGACSADESATGCTYDPAGEVTRAQMATLLVRAGDAMKALGGRCGGREDYFSDDDGSAHEFNINRARDSEIVTGKVAPIMYEVCLAQPRGLYAPEDLVRRDQSASTLARLLNIGVKYGPGSFEQPYPRGTSLTLKDGWSMAVIGSDKDATQEVFAYNPVEYSPPQEGHKYMIARVRATYTGTGTSTFDGGGRLAARGGYGSWDGIYPSAGRPCGDIPDELQNPPMTQGGTVEGNVCFELPEAPPANDPATKIVDRRWGQPHLPHFSRFTADDLLGENGENEASPYADPLPLEQP